MYSKHSNVCRVKHSSRTAFVRGAGSQSSWGLRFRGLVFILNFRSYRLLPTLRLAEKVLKSRISKEFPPKGNLIQGSYRNEIHSTPEYLEVKRISRLSPLKDLTSLSSSSSYEELYKLLLTLESPGSLQTCRVIGSIL